MSGSGLDLDEFLTYEKDEGSRKYMKNWKDDPGHLVVWLSLRAKFAYPVWSHPFQFFSTFVDEKTGKEVEYLKFHRFVSPDPAPIHKSQYFDDDATGRMRLPPIADPFLLLREWLRHDCDLPLDTVVFEWEHRKKGGEVKIIQWTVGELSRRVKRGKLNWNHSLDTKLEYLFLVLDHNRQSDGLQICRVAKGLGQAMVKAIKKEIDSKGEKGNPQIYPYAFKWVYDSGAKSFSDAYDAYRFEKAKLTDDIQEVIASDDFPDLSRDTRPRQGDKAKLRAAMEDAARIDLPWDLIFVDAWHDDGGDSFPHGENVEKKAKEERAPDVGGRRNEFSDGDGLGPDDVPFDAPPEEKPRERTRKKVEPEPTPRSRRRKKKEEPKPPPEPEKIPCEECGHPMLPTETKCPECGEEYEIDDEAPEDVSSGKPSAKGGNGKAKEETGDELKCWSCKGTNIEDNHCVDCGFDLTDDLPFG